MEHLGETHFWNIRNGNNLKMFTECEVCVCVKMVSIVAHLLRQQWSNIIKCINFDDSYISYFLKKKNLSSRRAFPKWGYPEKSIPNLSQIYPKSSRETIFIRRGDGGTGEAFEAAQAAAQPGHGSGEGRRSHQVSCGFGLGAWPCFTIFHGKTNTSWWFFNMFYFAIFFHILGIIILTNMFQRVWNHQPEHVELV